MKVNLRRSALAKSHRPFDAILTSKAATVVGGLDLGQVLVEVTVPGLQEIEKRILAAPSDSPRKIRDGKSFPNPARSKSEVGAIERLELYGPSDKRQFSLADALHKLADPRRGGSYFVELFEMPPPPSEWEHSPSRKRRLFESLLTGFRSLGPGMRVDRLDQTNHITNFLSVRLLRSDAPPWAVFDDRDDRKDETEEQLGGMESRQQHFAAAFDDNPNRHISLYALLDNHPLVKRIQIAPIPFRSVIGAPRRRPERASVPERKSELTYPVVGIVDGGIGPCLDDWIVHRRGTLSAADQDLGHGTFIGGLLVAGASLNGGSVCAERDGCLIYDVDILPADDMPRVFEQYYPGGFDNFFEEVEQAIIEAKRDHGVRIFNFSINDDELVSPVAASFAAQRLDAIADGADVIVVISAGNLNGHSRPEWPQTPVAALQQLASPRGDEMLATPAESARNVTVAAVNPPGLANIVTDAPANYSRRGPGLRIGVKPDYGHYGGSGTACPVLGHGLFSVAPDGDLVEHCGTSFAAPLIAKTFATLDHQIQGHVQRETLLALVAHGARIRPPLTDKLFKGIARHFVGFGQPASVDEMLSTPDSEITLVFNGVLLPGKNLDFTFTWPASLVREGGKCSGHAFMTLAYRPPLNHNFGAESIRVNLDAHLRQDVGEGSWRSRTVETFWEKPDDVTYAQERERIENGLKWAPIKTYETARMTGKGKSSTWQVFIEYITRASTVYPEAGIPFSLVLTIQDSKDGGPIFNEVRNGLQVAGADLAAIRTAARVRPRA
ncbi:MAG: S8 family peptidase [Vulcanimicrobiaceae bacterium]